ncbi:hypothetical protein [Bradyrhizobium sp. Ce-3]|uniref:hypothetical protein n=1 Tax=Bradyrhizobium sp. Ce-3 TaxID=2913970 RepID=UPI001FC832EE|nr:hypothetical protein [Bradyrhizobium sp. Ce-3]GKQ52023.1 hypothetical protein BRSPCE3_28780 [Bradyrhizobium sp. Ce-3]
MSDSEIPDKIGPALRWAIAGIALFVFFLIAAEKFTEGQFRAGAVNATLFVATFLVAVKWNSLAKLVGKAIIYVAYALAASVFLGTGIFIGTFFASPSRLSEPAAVGNIVWNFDQTANGLGYFLTMQKLSDQPEIRVVSFGGKGRNISDKPIAKFSGVMRSEQTNMTIPLLLLAQDPDESKAIACFPHPWIPTSADDTFGIPPLAEFEISSSEKPFIETGKDGIPLSKFMNDFVPFTIELEYDGTKYERRFTSEEVKRQLSVFEKSYSPQSNPRVTRKATAKPAPLLPLQTLLPADQPKMSRPGLANPIPLDGLPKPPLN